MRKFEETENSAQINYTPQSKANKRQKFLWVPVDAEAHQNWCGTVQCSDGSMHKRVNQLYPWAIQRYPSHTKYALCWPHNSKNASHLAMEVKELPFHLSPSIN